MNPGDFSQLKKDLNKMSPEAFKAKYHIDASTLSDLDGKELEARVSKSMFGSGKVPGPVP